MSKCIWGIVNTAVAAVAISADELYTSGNDIYFNCVIESASINKLQREIITVIKITNIPQMKRHQCLKTKFPQNEH